MANLVATTELPLEQQEVMVVSFYPRLINRYTFEEREKIVGKDKIDDAAFSTMLKYYKSMFSDLSYQELMERAESASCEWTVGNADEYARILIEIGDRYMTGDKLSSTESRNPTAACEYYQMALETGNTLAMMVRADMILASSQTKNREPTPQEIEGMLELCEIAAEDGRVTSLSFLIAAKIKASGKLLPKSLKTYLNMHQEYRLRASVSPTDYICGLNECHNCHRKKQEQIKPSEDKEEITQAMVTKLMSCPCSKARYCSKECQVNHMFQHKKTCEWINVGNKARANALQLGKTEDEANLAKKIAQQEFVVQMTEKRLENLNIKSIG